MTDADAFLAAIIANPDDDAPRLVYADWLDEQGQTERAEFIRVQCGLATIPDPHGVGDQINLRGNEYSAPLPLGIFACKCEYCQLRRRERELLAEWEIEGEIRRWAAWAGELIVRVTGETIPEFRRGFVAEITLSFAAWVEHRERLVKMAPLEKVTWTHCPPNVRADPNDTFTVRRQDFRHLLIPR